MRFCFAAVFAAFLGLVPQAALAHGDGPHAGEGAGEVHVASHPCPGGSGDCCCAKSVATPAKALAAPGAAWRPVVAGVPVLGSPRPLPFRSRPDFSVLARAPPAGR